MSDRKMTTLFSAEQIAAAIKRLAAEIDADYGDQPLVLICILKGSFLFTADLCRELNGPVEIEFIRVSSYGSGTSSSGQIDILTDLDQPIADRHVLIIEDIIDSGLTLKTLKQRLADRQPATLKICTLLDKQERRETDVKPDYVGFELESGFVVGYGLDIAERYRNLPDICVMEPDDPARRGIS